jgi:Bax protein
MANYKTTTQHTSIPWSFFTIGIIGVLCCLALLSVPKHISAQESSYNIYVHAGVIEDSIEYLKSVNYWNEKGHHEEQDVPRIIVIATSQHWKHRLKDVPVEVKKEIFYRSITPMVLYANELILEDRKALEEINEKLVKGNTLQADNENYLQSKAKEYGVEATEDKKMQLALLLERVDIIPPSLALGQAAYESGYATSRFAVEGNALFGQWTYSGKGMKPKEHRATKGNYSVAAYKWPFDSVRSYMSNLNTHNAYQDLRDKRVELRRQGKELSGLVLAETLVSYSEKGQEYVKTLKSIITTNDLGVADKTYLREEPVTLIVGIDKLEDIEQAENTIDELRASGELDRIVGEMRLGLGE